MTKPAVGMAQRRLVGTQFRPPQPIPDLVARPLLWARLAAGAQRPLTLVVAPGGYGKTTLVSSWLESQCPPGLLAAWYTANSLDNTLLHFVSQLLHAVQTTAPGALEGVAQLLQGSMPLTPEGLALQWVQDAAQLPGRLLLILDDYHEVVEPALHTFVATLLARAGGTVALMILSRYEPPFSVALLRSRQGLVEIALHDLQFDGEQSRQLLAGMLGRAVTPEEAAVLQTNVEGWAAGIRLLALSMQGRPGATTWLTKPAPPAPVGDFFMDYFMDEVLAKQPVLVRDFLLQTSLLPMLRVDLCQAVLGPTYHAEDLLEYVLRHNLFVVPLQDEPGAWRYHDIFRSLLAARLRRTFRPDEVTAAYHRVADGYAGRGEWERAIEYYLLADAPDAACVQVEALIPKLQNAEEWQPLDNYLARLPAAAVATRPALLLAQAWLHLFRFQLARLRAVLADLTRLLDDPAPAWDAAQVARWRAEVELLGIEPNAHFIAPTDLPEVERRFRAALDLVPAAYQYVRGSAWYFLTRHYQRGGRAAEALVRLDAELWSCDPKLTCYGVRLYHARCLILTYEADFFALRSAARTYRERAEAAGLRASAVSADFVALVALIARGEDDDEAIRLGRSILERAFTGILVNTLTTARLLLDLLAKRGAHAEAVQVLDLVRGVLRIVGIPETLTFNDYLEAALAVVEGNAHAARPWLMRLDVDRVNPDHCLDGLTWAQGMLALGTPESLAAARTGAGALLARCRAIHAKIFMLELEVILARIDAAGGDTAAARGRLCTVLALGRDGGYRQALLQKDPHLGRLLHELRDDPAVGALAAELLAARGDAQLPQTPPPMLPPVDADAQLTTREIRILRLLGDELTLREVADRLHLSPHTVDKHVRRIYQKLGVHSRHAALVQARAAGYLPPS